MHATCWALIFERVSVSSQEPYLLHSSRHSASWAQTWFFIGDEMFKVSKWQKMPLKTRINSSMVHMITFAQPLPKLQHDGRVTFCTWVAILEIPDKWDWIDEDPNLHEPSCTDHWVALPFLFFHKACVEEVFPPHYVFIWVLVEEWGPSEAQRHFWAGKRVRRTMLCSQDKGLRQYACLSRNWRAFVAWATQAESSHTGFHIHWPPTVGQAWSCLQRRDKSRTW